MRPRARAVAAEGGCWPAAILGPLALGALMALLGARAPGPTRVGHERPAGHPGPSGWKPLRAPLGWAGGKRRLVKEILARMPPHRIYVEPFVGAGHVYWAKPPAELEVINDIDRNLMRFYRFLKESDRFACDMTPDMERWYWLRERFRRGEELGPCDWFYLVKYAYGNKPNSPTPNPARFERCSAQGEPSLCMVTGIVRDWPRYKAKLARTVILNTDWEEVVRRFDGPDTWFYIDPPYTEWQEDPSKCAYVSCAVAPERVAQVLVGLEGKWLVTYDDHPRVWRAFSQLPGVVIERVGTLYELQKSNTGRPKPVYNLIIRNYRLPGERA